MKRKPHTAEELYSCPDCDRQGFRSMHGLNTHRKLTHGTGPLVDGAERSRTTTTARSSTPATDAALREHGDRLATNLAFVGMLVGTVMPHTGTTIITRVGDRPAVDPATGKPVVIDGKQHMKRGIVSVVMDAARRDERILTAVRRFNALFELEDAVELGLSLAAAVAADVGVDPHIGFDGGPLGEVRPIEQLIGDVVEAVEETRAAYAEMTRQEQPPAEVTPNGALHVPGGVEAT